VYGFIAPGLYRREKRLVFPFIFASTILFLAGCYFGYSLVLPLAYDQFLQVGGEVGSGSFELVEMITIDKYLSLTTKLLLAFGITFQVPVVISLLAYTNIVNWRQLVKFGRWWLLVSVVLGAFLTPPDPASQIMMAVPLNILYWGAIPLAALLGPKVVKPGETTEDGYER
jgi:sec-independent protein translocase protein TatC